MKKRALSILLALALCLSLLPATALAANDLSGHWAEDVITQWQEKGWVHGYGDGSFRPDAPITRAAFAKLLNQVLGFTEEAAISFTDVAEGKWYYREVARAVSAGYAQGYGDGTFRPEKSITRAEAAVMIARATGLAAQESAADGFSDEIPAWVRGSVGAVAAAGFMTGYADGTFGANATITRAAAVVALDRVAAKVEGTVTITEPGTMLEDRIIVGDLIVAESVGDGNVYLKNVTVAGSTYIKGGGSHSFYAENSTFSGTVYLQKNRLHMGLSGSTQMQQVQMEKPGSITFGKDYSGTVKNLNIPKDAPAGKYSIKAEDKDSTPVENMRLDAKADLSIDANISSMTIGENAEDSSITVGKDAAVDSMEVNSKAEITGKGTVGSMDVGTSGVTTGQELTVKDTTTSNGAAAPTTKPSGSYSYSTGSTTPAKPSVTITLSKDGISSTAATSNKFLSFKVTGATLTEEDLIITVTTGEGETLKTLVKSTDYTLVMYDTAFEITFLPFKYDTKYTVEIKASSTGAGKYSITGYTYEHGGIHKVTWQSGTDGIADIIPGTTIGASTASVTFTVDGATVIGDSSCQITAKLTGSSYEQEIESSRISPAIGSNTVTVDLQGLTLPAGEYTLTLNVPGYWLESATNRYVTATETATATFKVENKPVTLSGTTDTSPTFTSGVEVAAGTTVSFPVTGIASVTGATATIEPSGSDITAGIELVGNAIVVTLSGTPGTAATYTVNLTIPSGSITPMTGYTVSGDLSQSFSFTVKPVPTTIPVTVAVATPTDWNVQVAPGDDLTESPKIITFTITGVAAMDTSKVTVTTLSSLSASASFADGTLTITLTGSVPADAFETGGQLAIKIPKEAFTGYVDGYGDPGDDYRDTTDLKLDIRSVS